MMSGTSVDGIDAVALRFIEGQAPQLVAACAGDYPAPLRERLLALGDETQHVTPRQWAALDAEVGAQYAAVATQLLQRLPGDAGSVAAIGMHGQTVFHAPGLNSLQIGDPNRVAAATGLPVVADLRRRDLAEGGQGAPLVPAFHAAVFGKHDRARAIVNIGGIANLTWLPIGGGEVLGFDTGPGNALLDGWSRLHLDAAFDDDGAWAGSGRLQTALLAAWLDEPYFRRPGPKSTGRGLFNLEWCQRLAPALAQMPAADVQRTLLELTAASIAAAVEGLDTAASAEVYVCGGGARNGALMRRLAARLAPRCLASTAQLGLDPQHVEAAAFAWLALRRIDGASGNLPSVTGAARDVTLGAVYAG